jgi:hypothetical protein
MKIPFYAIFILLMLLGNCFGLYQLFADKQSFMSKYPKLNENNYFVLQMLPVINIIGLAGMWFLKSWSPWLIIISSLAVIIADIYFGIYYHLYLAIPFTLLLFFFILRYKNHFQ